jgi:hypothetical protein
LLVALALAVRLASPTGWMLAPGDGHGAPRLVICTGHGPLALQSHDRSPARAPVKSSDHACVFAGPAAPPAPSPMATVSAATEPVVATPAPPALSDQRPGHGLAAPPPPSHGPPAQLI